MVLQSPCACELAVAREYKAGRLPLPLFVVLPCDEHDGPRTYAMDGLVRDVSLHVLRAPLLADLPTNRVEIFGDLEAVYVESRHGLAYLYAPLVASTKNGVPFSVPGEKNL